MPLCEMCILGKQHTRISKGQWIGTFVSDVRPAEKAHPSQIVEWEADSLPKEASLEIQNRPRLEFEGEQQHNELSSKPKSHDTN
jgi:hypothetical protein